MTDIAASPDLTRLLEARHHDPFAFLGRHPSGAGRVVYRVFIPGAQRVRVLELDEDLPRVHEAGLFQWEGEAARLPVHPTLLWQDVHGHQHQAVDPYTFLPQIPDFDLYLFGEGKHHHAYRFLGANPREVDGVAPCACAAAAACGSCSSPA